MALNIPPPPPPPVSNRKPLGVPEDFTTTERGVGTADVFGVGVPVPATVQRPPRYYNGDELTPATASPEVIVQIQKALRSSGLIGPKTQFRVGIWDEPTRNAYRNLLEYANATGVDEREALRTYAATAAFDPESVGEGRSPLTVKVTNDADLRELFDVAARSAIGARLPSDQLDRMVAAYHGRETQAQTAAYNAGPTGGTVAAPMDPQLFAKQEAEAFDPTGKQELDLLSINDTLLGALKGGV